MFFVCCESPLDEGWEARDAMIVVAAGRKGDYNGTNGKSRVHGWGVKSFGEAQALREKLAAVPLVTATVRER